MTGKINASTAIFKYSGASVSEGYLEASAFAKAMLGLNGAFREISKINKQKSKEIQPQLLVKVVPGSIEFWLGVAAVSYAAKNVGVAELGKGFFNEIGKQLALKLFLKNNAPKKADAPEIINKELEYTLVNSKGDKLRVNHSSLELYEKHALDPYLADIVAPLQEKRVEKLTYLYASERFDILAGEKGYFGLPQDTEDDIDVNEDFEDSQAEAVKLLCGQFVTYKALASKYPFMFQVRENQNIFGKKLIYCALASENLRMICLDLMKKRDRNVLISGLGIKSANGQYLKLKIASIEIDSDGLLYAS